MDSVNLSPSRHSLVLASNIRQRRTFIEWALPGPAKTMSWALMGGGRGIHASIAWLHVNNDELGLNVCPRRFLRQQRAACELDSRLVLMTSAYLQHVQHHVTRIDDVEAVTVATVGLGNALRVGDAVGSAVRARSKVGTINIGCWINQTLSESAMYEALSLMAEAKAVAVSDLSIRSLMSGEPATGTGTDCKVLASAVGGAVHRYAGKHTAVGSAIGAGVAAAVSSGVNVWLKLNQGHPASPLASP